MSEQNAPGVDVGLNRLLDAPLQEIGNAICELIPDGFELSLVFESGAGYVELIDHRTGVYATLPDTADKSLLEQVQDALDAANARIASNASLSRSPAEGGDVGLKR